MSRENLDKRFAEIFGEDHKSEKELRDENILAQQKQISENQNRKNSLILNVITFPFKFVRFLFDFFIIGPSESATYRYLGNNNIYYLLSGFSIVVISILSFIFAKEIDSFIEDKGIFGNFNDVFVGIYMVFQFLQLIRGVSIMDGYQIMDFSYKKKEKVIHVYGKHRQHNHINLDSNYTQYSQHTQNRQSNRDEIDGFNSYVNSKMSMMSNSAKESYIKDLYGGKK
jgi:hypothetical protein